MTPIIRSVVGTLLTVVGVVSSLSLFYHYILLLAGIRRPRSFSCTDQKLSFAILIPAHNEESVIARTLDTLQDILYPRQHWDVFVAADHCTDATARMACERGATVLERSDGPHGRKAYALQWLIEQVLTSPVCYDALIIIDADSHLDPRFLQHMNAVLVAGHSVLQGQHVIANPTQSCYTRLADADMRINNLLRNQAKQNLGLSARLMGDAMCFTRQVLVEYGWSTSSMSEDRELGVYLAARGLKVTYVPKAISYGQGVVRWRDASAQRLRWQVGASQLRSNRVKELVAKLFTRDRWIALDQLAEMTLPSFSMTAFLSTCGLVAGAWLASFTSNGFIIWFAVLLFLAVAFPPLALLAAQAPASSFLSLPLGPAFVLWRIVLRLRAMLAPKSVRWVRTVRREELGK